MRKLNTNTFFLILSLFDLGVAVGVEGWGNMAEVEVLDCLVQAIFSIARNVNKNRTHRSVTCLTRSQQINFSNCKNTRSTKSAQLTL
jgi:hypothetical protein